MQCEVEIQQADRRHCDIWGSWGAVHYGGRERTQASFSFRAERPKLAVIYLNLVEDDEDDEDDEDNEDPLDEDDENPLHEAIVTQRMRLSEEEVCNLWDIIPPRDDFVGVPFVTRLISTMVDRHEMVCYTYYL